MNILKISYLPTGTYHVGILLFMFPDGAGGNTQHQTSKNTAALDRETEELHHERVSMNLQRAMQQARQAKGMTQKELATVSKFILP